MKNRTGGFRPTWQQTDDILDSIVDLLVQRMTLKDKEDNPVSVVDSEDESESPIMMRFGPRLTSSVVLDGDRELLSETAIEQATKMLRAFEKCNKGFKA